MAARTIIMLMLLLALASFIPFNMHINKTQTELKNRKQKWGAQCSHYELYPSHGCRRPSVPVVVGKLYKFCTEWLGGYSGGYMPRHLIDVANVVQLSKRFLVNKAKEQLPRSHFINRSKIIFHKEKPKISRKLKHCIVILKDLYIQGSKITGVKKTPRSAENLLIVWNLKTFLYPLKASLINGYTLTVFQNRPPWKLSQKTI